MPIIAIVGRPNVGKSMLFNKLAGRRLSIVEDTPGVTRDRLYAPCEWCGRPFTLIDTGGLEPTANDDMLRFMRAQTTIAIENADVILMICDVRTGVTAADRDIANLLKRSRKEVVLCVNKCDSVGSLPAELYEFYELGLGDPYPVSSLHGHGTGDLLDACFERFPPEEAAQEQSEPVRVTILGKPNVGKSSLLNKLLGQERVIVSDVAGTTRDAVDERLDNEHGSFIFTDTAGIRRKSKVEESIEHYSVLRAVMSIERSDVCLLMLDAREGVTEQDTKIAGLANEAGKPSVIVVNKWDAVEKDDKTMGALTRDIRQDLLFMSYAPVEFVSALTGSRVTRLFEHIGHVYTQNRIRISTGQLNDVLADAVTKTQPPTDKGRRLKIYYMTQASTQPPHFVAFCNDKRLFHFSYKNYIVNQIKQTFGLDGTPIRFTIRERGEKD